MKMTIMPLVAYAFAFSACMQTGAVVEYHPVPHARTAAVAGKISPKSVTWYKGSAPTDKPEVTVIGSSEVFVTNGMNPKSVIRQIKEVAAAHGANAIFVRLSNVNTSFVPYYTPAVTANMPKTSHTNASSQIYSPSSGYVGSVSTTATTTTMEPTEITPASSGIRPVQTGAVHVQFAVINTKRG
jgi:hypothetical protein